MIKCACLSELMFLHKCFLAFPYPLSETRRLESAGLGESSFLRGNKAMIRINQVFAVHRWSLSLRVVLVVENALWILHKDYSSMPCGSHRWSVSALHCEHLMEFWRWTSLKCGSPPRLWSPGVSHSHASVHSASLNLSKLLFNSFHTSLYLAPETSALAKQI